MEKIKSGFAFLGFQQKQNHNHRNIQYKDATSEINQLIKEPEGKEAMKTLQELRHWNVSYCLVNILSERFCISS